MLIFNILVFYIESKVYGYIKHFLISDYILTMYYTSQKEQGVEKNDATTVYR